MSAAAIRLIHVAKRELRMDDDDYRALLVRAGGQSSAKDLSEDGAQAVIEEMKRLGFKPRNANSTLSGPFAPKLVALWLSAWNLGIARNRHEHALIAFAQRQTGIAHVRWVRDQRDAERVIEALKKWMARPVEQGGGGVEWPTSAADGRANKVAVIAAQYRVLGMGEHYIDNPAIKTGQLDAIIAALGEQIRGAAR